MTDEGQPFLVTEWLAGGNLSGVLHGELPLPWSLRLRCALDSARGVAHLHSVGVVHRDLKSANVLTDATMQRFVVCDFGCARYCSKGSDDGEEGGGFGEADDLIVMESVGQVM